MFINLLPIIKVKEIILNIISLTFIVGKYLIIIISISIQIFSIKRLSDSLIISKITSEGLLILRRFKKEIFNGYRIRKELILEKKERKVNSNIMIFLKTIILEERSSMIMKKEINKLLNSNLNKKNITNYNYLLRKKKKEDDFENLIKSLDYKYDNRIKKDSELSLLDKSLKEVFSQDISSKYSRLANDSNEIIIKRIVIDEKDNDIIMFALNLTLREWIDVFMYKKELKDIPKINNLSEEKINQLSSLFDRVDNLLLDIYQKDCNKNYLSHFISLMYNYERWFFIKTGRNRSS